MKVEESKLKWGKGEFGIRNSMILKEILNKIHVQTCRHAEYHEDGRGGATTIKIWIDATNKQCGWVEER